MSAAIANILDEAANVIRRNGWYQGSFSDLLSTEDRRHRPCCAYGALNVAAGGNPEEISVAGEAAYDVLSLYLGTCGLIGEEESVPSWNDAPNRTADEVIAALEGAAAAERAKAVTP